VLRWTKISLLLALVFSAINYFDELPNSFLDAKQFHFSQESILGLNPFEITQDQIGFAGIKRASRIKFDITFFVTLNSLGRYQNLFQTASENQGIRLEVDPRGQATVIYSNQFGYQYKTFKTRIFPHQRYYFSLSSSDRVLQLQLDSEQLLLSNAHFSKDNFSSLLIGSGFNRDRAIDGELSKISLNISYLPISGTIHSIQKFLNFLIFIFCVYFIIKRVQQIKHQTNKQKAVHDRT